ncbi:hypothetical protein N9043_01050 [bacterium]|nr:hypothetical protein [bacterium]
MSNKFIPPRSSGDVRNCGQQACPLPDISELDIKCDEYTYGPFKAPAKIYTHYKYDFTKSEDKCCATGDGMAQTLCDEFKLPLISYEIYQIIEGEEFYVGEWTIKDKKTPNSKKIDVCGEYILRYCSEIPTACLSCFTHPAPPIIYTDCSESSPDVQVVCIKSKADEDIPISKALLKFCSSCSYEGGVDVQLYSIDGITELNIDDYYVVECC